MFTRINFLALSLLALAAALSGCSKSEQSPAEAEPQAPVQAVGATAPAVSSTTATHVGGAASRYEGKIVRQPPGAGGKDDGWFLVKDGTRRWISDGAWLEENGYSSEAVIEISSQEFLAIPEDPMPIGD